MRTKHYGQAYLKQMMTLFYGLNSRVADNQQPTSKITILQLRLWHDYDRHQKTLDPQITQMKNDNANLFL